MCRPASALRPLVAGAGELLAAASERPLGLDQSNTSAVVAERLLVKVFRRLEAGLNPDLELAAYLSEEAGFEATPRLAGSSSSSPPPRASRRSRS